MRPPPTCWSTTAQGKPCGFAARKTTGLCINHDPASKELVRQSRERGRLAAAAAREQRQQSATFDLSLYLNDRASIQAAIDTVLRLELTGQLTNTRTRNALRALALAVRNFDRTPTIRGMPRPAAHETIAYLARRRTLTRDMARTLSRPEGEA